MLASREGIWSCSWAKCLCRCPDAPSARTQTRSGLHQSKILYTFLSWDWRNSFYCSQPGTEPAGTHGSPPLLWARSNWQILLSLSDRSLVRVHWTADVFSDQDLLRPWSLFVQKGFLYRRRKHSSQAAGAQWNILVMDTPLSSSSHTPKGMMRTLSALPLFVYFSCLYSQLFHEEMWSRSGLNRANFFWRIRVILEISECNLHHWIKQWCRSMRAVNTKALLFCFYKSNWIKWQSQLKHPELITVPAVSFVCFPARVKG